MGTEALPCLPSDKCIEQTQPWIGNNDTRPARVSHIGMRLYRKVGFNFFCGRISLELAPPKPFVWLIISVMQKSCWIPEGAYSLLSQTRMMRNPSSVLSSLRGKVRGMHITHPLPSALSRAPGSAENRAWFLKPASSRDGPHCIEAWRSWDHCEGSNNDWETEIKIISEEELNKPPG